MLGAQGRAPVFDQRDPSLGVIAAHDRPNQFVVEVVAAGYGARASAFLSVCQKLFARKTFRALEDKQRGVAAQRLDRGQQVWRRMSARNEFLGDGQPALVVRSGEAGGEFRLEFGAYRRVGRRIAEEIIDCDAQPEETILGASAACERAEERQGADVDFGGQESRSVCDRGMPQK